MKKITLNSRKGKKLTVDLDKLRDIDWTIEDYLRDGQDGTECIVENDAFLPGKMTIVATCNSSPWESWSTIIDGVVLTIEDNIDGGALYLDFDEVCGGEDDGCEYAVSDILEILRDALDRRWPDWESVWHDYDRIAQDYYDEHQSDGYRYYIDYERGFANTWTLHILATPSAEPDDNWRRLTDEQAIVSYIADAAMSRRDYESEHGCMDAVGAVIH